MRVMPHPESAGQEPRQKLIPEPRSFTLLDAAMTSGLCLDLMLERLLQTAGEPGGMIRAQTKEMPQLVAASEAGEAHDTAHDARELTRGQTTAQITLDGKVYTLRITRAGKLILTK